jgi:hypothetical protein
LTAEELEQWQLQAAMAASAADAVDPKGKRPLRAAADAESGGLPEHVLQQLHLQYHQQQQQHAKQQQQLGTSSHTGSSARLRLGVLPGLSQEEVDAAMALDLDEQLNKRSRPPPQGPGAAAATTDQPDRSVVIGANKQLAAALAAGEEQPAAPAAIQTVTESHGMMRDSDDDEGSDEPDESDVVEVSLQVGRQSRRALQGPQTNRQAGSAGRARRRSQPAAAKQHRLLQAIGRKRSRQQQNEAGAPRAAAAAAAAGHSQGEEEDATWEPDDEAEEDDEVLRLATGVPAAAGQPGDSDNDDDDDDDDGHAGLLLPADVSSLDPVVLSTLPQSVQLDILERMRDAQQAGEHHDLNRCPPLLLTLQLVIYWCLCTLLSWRLKGTLAILCVSFAACKRLCSIVCVAQ